MLESIKSVFGKYFKKLIGAFLAITCLVILYLNVNIQEVIDALFEFNWSYLILAFVCLSTSFSLKILRWVTILRTSKPDLRYIDCIAPFVGSIALNNILPFRAGDIIRAVVFPLHLNISKISSTSSLIIEKIFDIMTLGFFLFLGIITIEAIKIPKIFLVSIIIISLIMAFILLIMFLFSKNISKFFFENNENQQSKNLKAKIYNIIAKLFHNINIISNFKTLIIVLFLTITSWLFEAGVFLFIAKGANIELIPLQGIFVFSLTTFSTILPFSPGYIGTFHLAAFFSISLFGVNENLAGSFAIIAHLALWLPPSIIGSLLIWANPKIFDIKKLKENIID